MPKGVCKPYKGGFTNYVYKRRGVGGQKKPNFVNVVCERPIKASYLRCFVSKETTGVTVTRGTLWSDKV